MTSGTTSGRLIQVPSELPKRRRRWKREKLSEDTKTKTFLIFDENYTNSPKSSKPQAENHTRTTIVELLQNSEFEKKKEAALIIKKFSNKQMKKLIYGEEH